jgi:predicted nucleic acid-binding protein
MKFWDASAVVPLIAEERGSGTLTALLEDDPELLVWWDTPVEIVAALARREREGHLTADQTGAAIAALHAIATVWQEIVPSDSVRRTAERLLRMHPLRSADSLQLAAAIVAADHDPASLPFVSLDERLNAAARREGFTIVGASSA